MKAIMVNFIKLIPNIKNKTLLQLLLVMFILLANSSNLLAVEYVSFNTAIVRVLNKITGKVNTISMPVGQIYNADNYLSFNVKACYKASQKYSPEDVMFIQVARALVTSKATLNNNKTILLSANDNVADLKTNSEELYNMALNNKLASQSATSNENQSNAADTDSVNNKEGDDTTKSRLIFSGWMFSNAPEVSALTDPTYDISIVRCM